MRDQLYGCAGHIEGGTVIFENMDRLHPNQIGATLMAREFLKVCEFDYNR